MFLGQGVASQVPRFQIHLEWLMNHSWLIWKRAARSAVCEFQSDFVLLMFLYLLFLLLNLLHYLNMTHCLTFHPCFLYQSSLNHPNMVQIVKQKFVLVQVNFFFLITFNLYFYLIYIFDPLFDKICYYFLLHFLIIFNFTSFILGVFL